MGIENTVSTNLKTLVVGCTPLARKVVNLLKKTTNLVGVVNLSPTVASNKSNYDSLSDVCDPFWTTDINDKETEDWIAKQRPDVIIQCGWSQIFKSNILSIPKKYCIGIHPSPLPLGRGAAIINWKIIESKGRDVEWGNSLFVMTDKTDTGQILDFEPFVIQARDNVRTAYQKVDQTSLTMLKRTIPLLALDKEQLVKQDNSKFTRYRKRKPKDGEMSFSWDNTTICDYVRALTHPYPGSYFQTKYGKMLVWEANKTKALYFYKTGTICKIIPNQGVYVKVGDHYGLCLERISIGGVEYWADDAAQQFNFKVGESLIE
jgi:methionyl-tRNA formyltransferase